MTVITLQHLARAMVERMGLHPEAAEALAEDVLDVFGFDSEVLDNVLDPGMRQSFYAMESSGLLAAHSEHNQLWQGQDWRTHTWQMRPERVIAAARAPARACAAPDEAAAVYRGLPSDVWARR